MTIIGGPIREVSLSSRLFHVVATCDAKVDRGGFVNSFAPALPAPMVVQRLVPWSIRGLEVALDLSQDDHQFLFTLQQKGELFPVVVSLCARTANDESISLMGAGTIVDEIEYSTARSTALLNLQGPTYPHLGESGRVQAGLEPPQ